VKKSRTKHSPALKAKVALAAIREQETVAEIARRHQLHANQVYKWKKELMDNMARVFEADGGRISNDSSEREAELLQKIGELTVERDFLSRGLDRKR
jgi:transposase-like protein